MQAMDLERLENVAEGLALLFYVLMFVALVMALAGSAGSGFLLLVVGSCAHIGQAALTEFVDSERAKGGRSELESRAKLERVIEPARRPQRVGRPVPAASPVQGRVRGVKQA
jgi:hypothetical protein